MSDAESSNLVDVSDLNSPSSSLKIEYRTRKPLRRSSTRRTRVYSEAHGLSVQSLPAHLIEDEGSELSSQSPPQSEIIRFHDHITPTQSTSYLQEVVGRRKQNKHIRVTAHSIFRNSKSEWGIGPDMKENLLEANPTETRPPPRSCLRRTVSFLTCGLCC